MRKWFKVKIICNPSRSLALYTTVTHSSAWVAKTVDTRVSHSRVSVWKHLMHFCRVERKTYKYIMTYRGCAIALCNQAVNVHTMLTTASLSHANANAVILPYRWIRLLELSRSLSWSAGSLDIRDCWGQLPLILVFKNIFLIDFFTEGRSVYLLSAQSLVCYLWNNC